MRLTTCFGHAVPAGVAAAVDAGVLSFPSGGGANHLCCPPNPEPDFRLESDQDSPPAPSARLLEAGSPQSCAVPRCRCVFTGGHAPWHSATAVWLAANSVAAAVVLVAGATNPLAATADLVVYYSGKEGVGLFGVIVCCRASL